MAEPPPPLKPKPPPTAPKKSRPTGVPSIGADLMDTKRKEHIAYEYLCHLEEAKKWIEACTEEELPPTTELEQALRNGVILCKLGHYCSPEVIPLKKIYDLDESRYRSKGLHFKHTDNFNYWLRSLAKVGLPKNFYPITTDLYDRKNMPRVIYCIHALSLYLHKLGKAPQIEDLLGTATFTEEEIGTMQLELDKYGINMPSFGKIGGILANEMSVDEATMHAAILALNEVLDKDSVSETFAALSNPNTCIKQLEEANAPRYHEILVEAKKTKAEAASEVESEKVDEERDVYDSMLTRDEIQGAVGDINTLVKKEAADARMRNAVAKVNGAIQTGGKTSLLRALQEEDGRFSDIHLENLQWYSNILAKARRDKAEAEGCEDCQLTHRDIQEMIAIANQVAERSRLVDASLAAVGAALEAASGETLIEALHSEHLDISELDSANLAYYMKGLEEKKKQKPNGRLTEEEVQDCINEMNAAAELERMVVSGLAGVNISAERGNSNDALLSLQNECLELEGVAEENADKYHQALAQARLDKEDDLTLDEVRKVIADVNQTVEQEQLTSTALHEVNQCLKGACGDSGQLVDCLSSSHCSLPNVQPHEALQYLAVMSTLRAAKAERTGNPDAELTLEELAAAIVKVNTQAKDAIELAESICAINSSVEGGNPKQALLALKGYAACIRSITDECAETYVEKLAAARQEKVEADVDDSEGWCEHRTRDGFSYYHNCLTNDHQWEQPAQFNKTSRQLSRDEVQAVVTKVTADYDRWTLMQSNEPLIVQLQACWRGVLVRKPFQDRLAFLRRNQDQAVRLQAYWKGFKQRKAYQERLSFLKKQTAVAIRIQSMARMWRARNAYRKRLNYLKAHEAEVVKIQAFFRARKAKTDYKQLVQVDQGTVPPTSTVRKFLALLEQSDIDFSEELECQRLKAQVVQDIRSNQQMEQDLDVMDIKIGLLVKNRISLQDVLSTSQQVRGKDKKGHHRQSQFLDQSSGMGVGGLSKANHEKVEAYQHLFYLLQTHPNYFAKLIFEMPQNRTNRFMENVILTVFNYAQNNREQYLLIKLFDTALKEEIDSKVDKLMDIVTGNPTVIKMVIHYTRGERGQNVLRDLLGPLVKEVVDQKDLVLNTGPVDVYRAWINQMESETGEATKLPYDVSNDHALEHEEVRQRVQETITKLCILATRFQQSIFDNIDKIPYAMRYIAMQLRLLLHSKFPEASEDEVLKIVGNLVYYRYMNPAIVAPDAFDIIDVSVEQQLTPEQRRNLGSIAKVLQHASAGKMFEDENAALAPMNPYIKQAFTKFKGFFLRASTVDPPEVKLGIDEYSDVTMLAKPVIYISVKEICSTHSLLIDHEEAVAPQPDDPLHLILKDLGPSPSVESLIGGVRETIPGEDREDLVAQAGKQEIPLTLTNKFESLAESDSTDTKALFVRTKRMVVDVLKVQPGENLTNVLYTPATPEQEAEHQELLQRRNQVVLEQSQRSELLKVSNTESMHGDRNLPLEGMKRKIMRNLRSLEQDGMVNSKNDYQEIINAIAKDIRNQHRYRQQRKQELKRLSETMEKLSRKSKFYEDQMNYYHQYIKACLDQLAKTGAKTSGRVRRGTGEDGSGFKKQSVKYNAHKLHEKGVILEIEGLPNHQFRNVSFEITSVDVGLFEVTGRFLGKQIEKVELVFQDLLQLQYEGLAIMQMFGRAKINVNLLIYLINKKFYGRVL